MIQNLIKIKLNISMSHKKTHKYMKYYDVILLTKRRREKCLTRDKVVTENVEIRV